MGEIGDVILFQQRIGFAVVAGKGEIRGARGFADD